MNLCSICFVSVLFCSTLCSWYLFKLLHVSCTLFNSLLYNIPLYEDATIYLSIIHKWIYSWTNSLLSVWTITNILVWLFLYRPLDKTVHIILLCIYNLEHNWWVIGNSHVQLNKYFQAVFQSSGINFHAQLPHNRVPIFFFRFFF